LLFFLLPCCLVGVDAPVYLFFFMFASVGGCDDKLEGLASLGSI
jgi:hypothetical protein